MANAISTKGGDSHKEGSNSLDELTKQAKDWLNSKTSSHDDHDDNHENRGAKDSEKKRQQDDNADDKKSGYSKKARNEDTHIKPTKGHEKQDPVHKVRDRDQQLHTANRISSTD